MSNYLIRDLEQISGIKAHTIRIWEQRYNIIQPKRTDTNIRQYDNEDLRLILSISYLRDHGHKISDIAKMTHEEISREIIHTSENALNYADQIHALTISMIDMNEVRFEKIISTNLLKFGLENTMLHIIYPFLTKVGMFWITGSIGPAQEHFISNLIRQKLIVAIDSLFVEDKPSQKSFLLYLPENEIHEIGLLFAHYIIKAHNHKAIYFGQNLPFDEIVFAHKHYNPDYIVTAFTVTPSGNDVQLYIDKLLKQFPDTKIIVMGAQTLRNKIHPSTNLIVVKQVEDLKKVVSQ